MKLQEIVKRSSHSSLLNQWIESGSSHHEDPDDITSPKENAIQASERRIREYNGAQSKFDLTSFDYEIRNIPLSKLVHIQNADGVHHESMIGMAKEHTKSDYSTLFRKHDVLPILINPDFEVLDGYHRIAAAVHNGLTTIPALVPIKPGTGKVKSQ